MFLRNLGSLSPYYMPLHFLRQFCQHLRSYKINFMFDLRQECLRYSLLRHKVVSLGEMSMRRREILQPSSRLKLRAYFSHFLFYLYFAPEYVGRKDKEIELSL
jgi:hypothetical protein